MTHEHGKWISVLQCRGNTWTAAAHPAPVVNWALVGRHRDGLAVIPDTPSPRWERFKPFITAISTCMSQREDLPWILLEKSQQRNSASVSAPLSQLSCHCHHPCSSQRYFPQDRLGENIFVIVWTDFPLMIHNFGMQSGNDDDHFPHLPLLMKRKCLWGWGQKVNSPVSLHTIYTCCAHGFRHLKFLSWQVSRGPSHTHGDFGGNIFIQALNK